MEDKKSHFHTQLLPSYYLCISKKGFTQEMVTRVTDVQTERYFIPTGMTTALYLAEFQRLFRETQAEIEQQRQSQFALARSFFEQAKRRFKTSPNQAPPTQPKISQLLLECMRHHPQTDNTEPPVLTMEIATALATLARQPNPPPRFSSGTYDFLTEAGILPSESPAIADHQPVYWAHGSRVTGPLR